MNAGSFRDRPRSSNTVIPNFSKALFEGLIFWRLMFEGAYLRREICVSSL